MSLSNKGAASPSIPVRTKKSGNNLVKNYTHDLTSSCVSLQYLDQLIPQNSDLDSETIVEKCKHESPANQTLQVTLDEILKLNTKISKDIKEIKRSQEQCLDRSETNQCKAVEDEKRKIEERSKELEKMNSELENRLKEKQIELEKIIEKYETCENQSKEFKNCPELNKTN